jgi:hypothetical protein
MSYRYFFLLLAMVAGGWLAAPPSAQAQYAPGYDRQGQGLYPDDPRDLDRNPNWRRAPRGGYDRDDWDDDGWRGRGRGGRSDWGRVCVTSRGNCRVSAPRGISCRCEIPGFGRKRGIVR